MDILTLNLFSVPPRKVVLRERGPAQLGRTYTNLTLAKLFRTYRLHAIYTIDQPNFQDKNLGLHDTSLGGVQNDPNFRSKKSRVKMLYEYAKAESKNTCLSSHNLLFVRKDNPTLVDGDEGYEEWNKRVEAAANQVARDVFRKIVKELEEIRGKKIKNKKYDSASTFEVGTAVNAIETIKTHSKKNEKQKNPMVADPEASESSGSGF
jgi:hypothetical protein